MAVAAVERFPKVGSPRACTTAMAPPGVRPFGGYMPHSKFRGPLVGWDELWPIVAATAKGWEWPVEMAAEDLLWWDNGDRKRPGRKVLAARWNWGEGRTRRFIEAHPVGSLDLCPF